MEAIADFGAKIGGAAKDRSAPRGPASPPSGETSAARKPRKPAPRPWLLFYNKRAAGAWVQRRGDRAGRRLIEFADVAAGWAFLRLPESDGILAAAWETIRDRTNVTEDKLRGADNAPRRAYDYRQGQDIAPDDFLSTFKPYGVEFGNWQTDRQGAVNAAYDALQDLSYSIAIPPAGLFLGGSLGLAFGARGHGAASAHYEPDYRAINLTKPRGAGCLAHEWFHAWDHHQSGRQGFTLTEPLRAAWGALRRLPVYQRSVEADKTRAKVYYSTSVEVTARCFEAWVRSRVDNDYLANINPIELFICGPSSYPYPKKEEMPAIDAIYRGLFPGCK